MGKGEGAVKEAGAGEGAFARELGAGEGALRVAGDWGEEEIAAVVV